MIFDIKKPLPECLEFQGHKYKLNLSFNNILNVFEVLQSSDLSDIEKYEFIAVMLSVDKKIPTSALSTVFNEFISITRHSEGNSDEKVVDFLQDSVYIYSSFMADYGIDLFDQQDKLHWWKFVSLFQGLSENTKMHQVISIRQRPIPTPNKYNSAEIQQLRELKQFYALEISQQEREQNFNDGISKLAENLKARAKAR